MIFWIREKLRRIILADDRHALRSARAQEDKLKSHSTGANVMGPSVHGKQRHLTRVRLNCRSNLRVVAKEAAEDCAHSKMLRE